MQQMSMLQHVATAEWFIILNVMPGIGGRITMFTLRMEHLMQPLGVIMAGVKQTMTVIILAVKLTAQNLTVDF